MAAPMSTKTYTSCRCLLTRQITNLFRRNLWSTCTKLSTDTNENLKTSENTKYAGSGDKETHFGFERISVGEKTEKVYEVFKNVAEKYDVMNDAMSLGIHRIWKDRFLQVLSPTPGTRLLDVAGGTGDIAFRFLDFTSKESKSPQYQGSAISDESSHVSVCDINLEMLNVGKKRAQERGINKGLSWIAGNAEELPVASGSVDAYTIAFGIRNVTHVQKALEEAHRVLVPGGRFLCLEFSHVQNPALKSLYDNYSFQMIPVLGEVIAGDWKSYQYLVESIRQFPDQEEFAAMMKDAGFRMVTYENLSFGIAAIHSGFKL